MALARNAQCEADPRSAYSQKSEIDPLDQPVWGQQGIAKILNMSPKCCEHLLRGGDSDAFVAEPNEHVAQMAFRIVLQALWDIKKTLTEKSTNKTLQ
jgi:hypothetical protein